MPYLSPHHLQHPQVHVHALRSQYHHSLVISFLPQSGIIEQSQIESTLYGHIHDHEVKLVVSRGQILGVILARQSAYLCTDTIDMSLQISRFILRSICIHISFVIREGHLGIHHHMSVVGEMQDKVGYHSSSIVIFDSFSETISECFLSIKLFPLVQFHILEQLLQFQFSKVSLYFHFSCECSGETVGSLSQGSTLLHVGLNGGIQSVESYALLFFVLVQRLLHLLEALFQGVDDE